MAEEKKTGSHRMAEETVAAKTGDGNVVQRGEVPEGGTATLEQTYGQPKTEYETAQDKAGVATSDVKTVPPDTMDPADRSQVVEALLQERDYYREEEKKRRTDEKHPNYDPNFSNDGAVAAIDEKLAAEGYDTSKLQKRDAADRKAQEEKAAKAE